MVETNRFQLDNSQGPELIDFDLPLHERPGAFFEWVLSKAGGKGLFFSLATIGIYHLEFEIEPHGSFCTF
jgi:hypothetical protein